MTKNDRVAFAQVMLGLGEAYHEEISDGRMEIYFAALSDLALDDIRRAASVHVRTQKFYPRVSELREAIGGSVDDRADLAWMELLKLVRRVGYYGEPALPDEVSRRAATELYGGWRALCERLPSEGPELLAAAKLFKASYAAHARLGVRESIALPNRAETHAQLVDLRDELTKRGLPATGLPVRARSSSRHSNVTELRTNRKANGA
jgi:hypothetical protein